MMHWKEGIDLHGRLAGNRRSAWGDNGNDD